ncbi:HipA domain-containing protein [Eoetvoesiella caeni]|uniref:Serine/threonine-protein kinase HipA n=1 Tax=Eoetvoesiella caeni TaxID=645616 RepID=A0A366H2B8_9BURK|nr:HipA domain-containing protein [Eoetvoesiella caeni]MCI2808371.1 HipA domain-containing protein [Eoetvoesiella caeni]NYT53626.1 HipA domain-containing protein [Eoetvoesiella caeni]RBP36042.1 serine/threonine-protein kinase HipA [Eoetvoesiella caeni]
MSGQLGAYINNALVGALRDASGVWSFQYAQAWLHHPDRFALSPHLPLQGEPLVDGASERPVQWYFDNLLPEEGQRTLLAKDAKIETADAMGLLAYYGAESAGSITLLPEGSVVQGVGGLRALPDADLSARIRNLPNVPLTQAAIKRMSLAGAQHKLAVVLDAEALFEPYGAQPSTHILKPDHPGEDYPHSAVNEWFVMVLAARLGLQVPKVYRRYVPEPVYLIERFDRSANEAGWQRRHVIDACQLLGLDRSFKYAQGSVESLACLAALCRSSAVARTRLYQWLVFNVLVGNSDAHLKNLSFLVTNKGIELAPHYDLLSVACYESRAFEQDGWPAHTQLAWPILAANRFAELNALILVEAGQVLGLAAGTARRLLLTMRERVLVEAGKLYDEMIMQNAQLVAARPELGSTLAGESRGVRAIVHTVMNEMATRMRID